jgi:hypothetical protein
MPAWAMRDLLDRFDFPEFLALLVAAILGAAALAAALELPPRPPSPGHHGALPEALAE